MDLKILGSKHGKNRPYLQPNLSPGISLRVENIEKLKKLSFLQFKNSLRPICLNIIRGSVDQL